MCYGKTVKFSEKFAIKKDVHFYLLCLVLNPPATILGKKLVLNLRLTHTMRFKNSFINHLVFKDELAR